MIKVDFSRRSDPPLLKKIAMYNSGIPGLANYERDIDRLLALNAESLRIDLSIGKRHCLGEHVVKGSIDHLEYDFSILDRLAEMLNERGVLPYYSWCYIPESLQRDGHPSKLNDEVTGWEEIYKEIHREFARHYRESNIRIGYHEIYNEPDLPNAFLMEPYETYLSMYKAGAAGMKQGDPDAVVGGPALAMADVNMSSRRFTDFVAKEKLPLEFFSFHVYWEHDDYRYELQCARDALIAHPEFKTVPIHVNEFNYVGGWQGKDSIHNHYRIVPHIFDLIKDVLKTTDVILLSWAQFMESTFRDDAYGIIFANGHVKAAFNALKVYADMPVERATTEVGYEGIASLASADKNRACTVLWNRTDEDRSVKAVFNGIGFETGHMRIYRMDRQHASYSDGACEELEVSESLESICTQGMEWSGMIPASGAVYIVIEDGSFPRDFIQYERCNFMARDIETKYYFEDRNRDNYQFFDRKTWKAYLGMGENEKALSLVGVVAEDVPKKLAVTFKKSGTFVEDQSSILGLRIDYSVNGRYEKAVFFHDGLCAEREEAFPWGTEKNVDRLIPVESLDAFTLSLEEFAPAGWNHGRILLSFVMKDTGKGSRADIGIYKA